MRNNFTRKNAADTATAAKTITRTMVPITLARIAGRTACPTACGTTGAHALLCGP